MNDAEGGSAVNARIVYWGAEGAGKRTNLRVIHAKLRPDHRGELRFLPTRLDPTVTYATLPIELGEVGGVRTRIQIVALPGEPEHAHTRKQLLDRTDGVVLVLDARRERLAENLASLEELKTVLAAYGRRIDEMPLVVQYNKRDLADPYALEDLHRKLAMRGATAFEAVAKDGTGVLQTLTTISKRVIRSLRERAQEAEPAPASPAARRAPVAKSAAPSAANAVTQVRLGPARPAPPPGVTQVLDRAAFEATIAKPAAAVAPPPGTTQLLERVVTPEDSQPGVSAPPATFEETVSEAESVFEASFETAKRSPATAAAAKPAPRAPTAKLEVAAEPGASGFAIEPAGPAQVAPGGLRIPFAVRDASGRRTQLTLTLRFESEDA
ncbi:MAG TPA: GTPase domain-containing protein [Myxococcota bacterium]|nr:GTPase domain-containing protein [Myxococcota bacterium]